MTEKTWVNAIGTPGQNPTNSDQLLNDTISKKRKKDVERQIELDEKEHAARLAKLDKEKKVAEADTEKVDQKGTQQPLFQVKGSVDLGNLDLQKQQEEAKAELKQLKQDQDESIQRLGHDNQELRERIHAKELEVMQTNLLAQIQASDKRIEQLIAASSNRGSVLDEIKSQKELAKELGYLQPEGSGDLQSQIELKKLSFEQEMRIDEIKETRRLRDHEWEIEKEKRQEDREARKAELDQQKRSQDMWAGLPSQIGGAIARGLEDQEQRQPPTGQTKKRHRLQAAPGDAGDYPCPSCGNPVGIGPTARTAECVECGDQFTINRVEKEVETAEGSDK